MWSKNNNFIASSLFYIFLLSTLIGLSACKKRMPLTVEKIGDNQVAPLKGKLPQPIQVKVLNHKGEPIPRLAVSFSIKNGSGFFEDKVFATQDTTDEDGIASAIWYLGVEETEQQVEAKVKRFDETLVFTASPEYYTDSRDGEVYLLVQVGQTVWMGQNLRHSPSFGSLENPQNPSPDYGRLYTWPTAQTICPTGFRLPTDSLFQELVTTIGNEFGSIGYKIKSRSNWHNGKHGDNLSGLNLLPAGNYLSSIGSFRGLTEYTAFWTSEEADPNNGYYRILGWDSDEFYSAYYAKNTYSSCRCVKE